MAKKPIMLLFHPGGFVYDAPMTQEAAAARARGFKPRVVNYPLLNVPAAFKSSTRLAKRLDRRGREVYAYGGSAGGALAGRLAQKGLVRAAAVHSPVSNIPQYIASTGNDPAQMDSLLHLTPQSARKFSLNKGRRTRSPILALTPSEDALSPVTSRWARKQPGVRAVSVPGQHLDPQGYPADLQRAMQFLTRARRRSR